MEGTDNIWSIEEDSTKSVINVLFSLSINKNNANSNNVSKIVLDDLREKFRVAFEQNKYSKLFNKRIAAYGYNFWIRKPTINFTNIIHFFNVSPQVNANKETLQSIMSTYCNNKLPQNHEFGWEILVSPILFNTTSNMDEMHLPVS